MEVTIDWQKIITKESFYEVFLPQLNAPEWHGHNLDAVADSVIAGDVNGIEPPYTIISKNESSIEQNLKPFQQAVLSIFKEAKESGREVHLVNL